MINPNQPFSQGDATPCNRHEKKWEAKLHPLISWSLLSCRSLRLVCQDQSQLPLQHKIRQVPGSQVSERRKAVQERLKRAFRSHWVNNHTVFNTAESERHLKCHRRCNPDGAHQIWFKREKTRKKLPCKIGPENAWRTAWIISRRERGSERVGKMAKPANWWAQLGGHDFLFMLLCCRVGEDTFTK